LLEETSNEMTAMKLATDGMKCRAEQAKHAWATRQLQHDARDHLTTRS